MKKFFKRLFLFVVCLALAFCAVRFGPNLYERFFGGGNTRWISQQFSETLKEKNELVVYSVETTGQETVSQDAWLLGTVQKVVMPYTYNMSYMVDLSIAKVSADGNVITIRVPSPVAAYSKLTVDEEKMKKNDWLYPLTPERYASIKQQVETRLFEECEHNPEFVQNAWSATVKALEDLIKPVVERSEQGETCKINVVEDDTLTLQPDPSAQPEQSGV